MSRKETLNPFAAARHEYVRVRPATAAATGNALFVETISRRSWILATVLGTALGGGLFYPVAFFIGAPLAAAVALPIVASISCLIRSGIPNSESRLRRVMYSVMCGAVTGLFCVFVVTGTSLTSDIVTLMLPYILVAILGGTCAGTSSYLFGSCFRLRKLASLECPPLDFPEPNMIGWSCRRFC